MRNGPEYTDHSGKQSVRFDDPRRIRIRRLRQRLTGALLLSSLGLTGGALLTTRIEATSLPAANGPADAVPPTTVFIKSETAQAPTPAPSDTPKSAETGKTPLAKPVSQVTAGDIPPDYLALYQREASACIGLSWPILAAVGKVESGHGRNKAAFAPNSKGALGPMQFLPATWGQYGKDGNGDGVKDILDPADAIKGAANMLCETGLRNPSAVKTAPCSEMQKSPALRKALFSYNPSCTYVRNVFAQADGYSPRSG